MTVSPQRRAEMGDYQADRLERLLNYPVGADIIEAVIERDGGRPAELRTWRHHTFPFVVIWKPELIAFAKEAARNTWRVRITTKYPRGGGDSYVRQIERV